MAAKVIQTVRTHIPLIKFPNRGLPAPPIEQVQQPSIISTLPKTMQVFNTSAPRPLTKAAERRQKSLAESKPIGYTARGSGIDSFLLPSKYQRQAIPMEEIDYILRGGPE